MSHISTSLYRVPQFCVYWPGALKSYQPIDPTVLPFLCLVIGPPGYWADVSAHDRRFADHDSLPQQE